MMGILCETRVWHARHSYSSPQAKARQQRRMIDIKSLRQGLAITNKELAEIAKVTGIGRSRLAMAEHGLLPLKPEEEATLRLAISYTMHCRSVRLAAKLAQGSALVRSVPMTWDEHLKAHRKEKQMARQMKVIVVSLDLVEESGRMLFPLSEPIPWEIAIDDTAAKVLATCPAVLESMITAIRSVVALHSHQ